MGIWHIVPIVLIPVGVYAAPLSPSLYIIAGTLKFLVGAPVAFRVLMVWVYDRTGSLSVSMLMHAALTAASIIYEPEAIGGTSLIVYDAATAAAMWIVVAIVVLINRGSLEGGRSV